MDITVGRFEGYIPDKDPTDILLAILSRLDLNEKKELESSALHSILCEMKDKGANLLQDFSFSGTSFFPYSEEVALAMRDLKSSGYIVCSDSRYSSFIVSVDSPFSADWMSEEEKQIIEKISERLRSILHG